jgi:hypothetical protein
MNKDINKETNNTASTARRGTKETGNRDPKNFKRPKNNREKRTGKVSG